MIEQNRGLYMIKIYSSIKDMSLLRFVSIIMGGGDFSKS